MNTEQQMEKHFQDDRENFKKIDVFLAKQEIHNEMHNLLLKEIQNDVKEVVIQTKKTNGRVDTQENWRAYLTGALAVIITFLLPVIFMIVSNYLKK